jgi:hypothetical protein
LGVLVTGAERVEHEVEHLKRNFRALTEKQADSRITPTLRHVKKSLEHDRIQLRAGIKKIKPVGKRLENETRQFLQRTNIRSRIMLVGTIDWTIIELERFKQKLDQGSLTSHRSA